MKEPVITKDMAVPGFDSRFIKVYDLQYAPGAHYYDATRRDADTLVAVKSNEEYCTMLPDAVGLCVVILNDGEEPKMLLEKEYRYPLGRFILGPPSGIIDPEDQKKENPHVSAAIRELKEETGLEPKDGDRVFVANPALFSSPGMTDESCGLVCTVLHNPDLTRLTTKGAEDCELFAGFEILTETEVRKIVKDGRDMDGRFYSVFTWVAMMYFLSGFWK